MTKTYWNPYSNRRPSPDAAAAEDTSERDETICPECGFEAKNARGLASHMRSHED